MGVLKKILTFLFVGVSVPAMADDCVAYKLTPKITIDNPSWVKEVVQPLEPMDLWHGNVVATMVDNYDIVADVTSIEDGFCIGLKSVHATIGYSDFSVRIDIRHTPNTCSYDAVLAHEDQHIRQYLSVIDDFKEDLHKSVFVAADSVMPIFVPDMELFDAAIDELNKELQAHPDLILVKQKIKAEEEIRNKRVDLVDTGAGLKKCFK